MSGSGNALAPLAIALAFAVASPAAAAPRDAAEIWSALVLATQDEKPRAEGDLGRHEARLRRLFTPFNRFKILDESSGRITSNAEHRLTPGHRFSLATRTSQTAPNAFEIALTLFNDSEPLVETTAQLTTGSPLFIRGPQYGDGQLIIVLEIR